mmetsp:Transcript_18615/g.21371  ORF Transcript_18615/g.21371 Transcript_18615/m.21371 type:complete len:369 (+) Transcript_18615:90-1196(+)
MMIHVRLLSTLLSIILCSSFMIAPVCRTFRPAVHVFSTTNAQEIESMRAGEIKKELESYGVSTKSFLEKSELVEALEKARADGLKPKSSGTNSNTESSSSNDTFFTQSSTESSSSKRPSGSSSSRSNNSRDERLKEERKKCGQMKARDLRKELEIRGISTKSFFEKSEFVNALAEAIVDGADKRSDSGTGQKSTSTSSSGEGYAEYSNVEVITDDSAGPRKKKNRDQQQQDPSGGADGNPFGGAGGNPFGGAGGNPFGGGTGGGMPGGMGGIADILKNMGTGGAAGGATSGNPFGGGMGGSNPFGGDMMGKAQEMMKNPKVMELMMKAQSNPKVAKAMQEVMANPAAMAKYQNDPEIAELMRELQKYI